MDKEPTPKALLAAIRANCLECCGGSRMEVRKCKIKRCRLWPYRTAGIEKKKTSKRKAYKQITIFELLNETKDEDC